MGVLTLITLWADLACHGVDFTLPSYFNYTHLKTLQQVTFLAWLKFFHLLYVFQIPSFRVLKEIIWAGFSETYNMFTVCFPNLRLPLDYILWKILKDNTFEKIKDSLSKLKDSYVVRNVFDKQRTFHFFISKCMTLTKWATFLSHWLFT